MHMTILLILDVPFNNGHFDKYRYSFEKLQSENIHCDQGMISFLFVK